MPETDTWQDGYDDGFHRHLRTCLNPAYLRGFNAGADARYRWAA